ncbi:MAG: hypothetical protein IJ796_10965 [Lachnospiraceae bacterium]|nr:hypothetical protein [Lachnospiraceae bacterium]
MRVYVEAKQFPINDLVALNALDGIRREVYYVDGNSLSEKAEMVVDGFLEVFPEANSWDITLAVLK